MPEALFPGFKDRVKCLYSFKGYFEAYFILYAQHQNGPAAFEALEREYYDIFGQNRYRDYNVFREMRRRYAKSLQKARKKATK